MVASSNINNFSEANYFKELPFYNKPVEKPKIYLLAELPFYEQLNIIKTNQAFKGYAMSYKVEIIEKKRSDLTIRSKQIKY